MGIILKRTLILGGIVCFLCVGVYGGLYVKKTYRKEILESHITQRMIPLYRSLRKLPDIVFMPWSAFATTNLETYELTISPQNIERMNSVLPEQPFNSGMGEDSKLWVKGYFRAAGYEDNVDVRYRGNLSAHWNAYQKSYSIKFPKDHLFNGMRELTLVIPSKRRYLAMPLNDYRAEKLDLIHPDESLVKLEVNGADTGVLLAFEGWSQPWIEKMPISSLSTIYGVDEGAGSYQERWDSWNAEEPIDFEPLETLEEIVEHASDEEFKKLIPLMIDIEDWYAWDVMRILATGYHVTSESAFGSNNLVIVFDRAEGRFKPVPYNTVIYTPSFRKQVGKTGVTGGPTRLYQRILSVPEFRARRDEFFTDYVKNEKADDLRFLQEWQDTYNREFLMDNAKNDNNFMYLAEIKENVQAATDHFNDPFDILSATYTPEFDTKEILDIPDSFEYLLSASADIQTAAAQNPSIWVTTDGLYIPPGTHWFDKTIIIPKGTLLTIAPGTALKMSNGASFISYSPVQALGTSAQPITITGHNSETVWGVFAVLNTASATSTLKYVNAENGGEDTINGAYISGTLAFHNSNVLISNSTVQNAHGDDGVNVKGAYVSFTNNTLTKNSSDGIDLDYVDTDSIIQNNTFLDNAGDSIDLSWSNITINDNVIIGCGDKGISAGEKSSLYVTNNTITQCGIGIASKDSSVVKATSNTFNENTTVFSAYQKKLFFGGGTIYLNNNTLSENEKDVYADEQSLIELF